MQGRFQRLAVGSGVDEDERAALVSHQFGGLVEHLLQIQRGLGVGQIGQQIVLFGGLGCCSLPFQLDPCTGHVVGHGFHAGADKAVLGNVLERAVAHELGGHAHAGAEAVLQQGIDAAVRKLVVHGDAHVFGSAQGEGRAEHAADFVFRGDMGLLQPAAHIRRKVHAAGGGRRTAHAKALPAAVRFRIRGSMFRPRWDCISRRAWVVASTWSSWAAPGNCVSSAMYSDAHGQWEG